MTLLEAGAAPPDPYTLAALGLLGLLGALGKLFSARKSDESKPALVKVDAAALWTDMLEQLRMRGPSVIGGPLKGDWQRAGRHWPEAVEAILDDFEKLIARVAYLEGREKAREDEQRIEDKARELEEERHRHRQSGDYGEAEPSIPGRRRKDP
jgi:hypothetical protein